MNENENKVELDDVTQEMKKAAKANKKKSLLERMCDKESYNDKGVYYFNKSLLVGFVILMWICFVLFLK